MNYELARKLKDAKFPQNTGIAITSNNVKFNITKTDILTDEMCYEPTLSELIEECGKDIEVLCQTFPGWTAYSDDPENSSDYKSGIGNTPEEAVANLWLVLVSIKKK
jgi:hypothetical protein